MAIDVEWQNERGQRLARYDGPAIDARLPQSAPEGSACLRFIDPYGDTTFNAMQIPVLEEELAALVERKIEPHDQAIALLSFLRSVTEWTHRYLKFIGD
jgi:hypothetical protein